MGLQENLPSHPVDRFRGGRRRRVIFSLTVKGQLKASTPAEYLAQVDDSRKPDITALDALIRKNAPKLTPFIYIGILGYGRTLSTDARGREVEGCRIGVASNASYISMYVGGAVAGQFRQELPKAKI